MFVNLLFKGSCIYIQGQIKVQTSIILFENDGSEEIGPSIKKLALVDSSVKIFQTRGRTSIERILVSQCSCTRWELIINDVSYMDISCERQSSLK